MLKEQCTKQQRKRCEHTTQLSNLSSSPPPTLTTPAKPHSRATQWAAPSSAETSASTPKMRPTPQFACASSEAAMEDSPLEALLDDSNKVYTRPLYAEPQVREAGKPHYAPEDMYAFVGGHSNQHRVDRAVNELKDTSLKAELTRYRAYKHEAERMEQRLHALAQALGGVQGELTRSKFRLEMANTWDRITEAQEGWMGGIGPTRRRGRRS
ncbi:hypothetical protein EDB85DRAFT_2158625 [Lactarius pseudohatsudake]|nr:hypothetical protein EDB85DRAFT_2158625 [Lactarius pseudohatsudake]